MKISSKIMPRKGDIGANDMDRVHYIYSFFGKQVANDMTF
jgi:hypothetical protein